jgi:hypothetical protein
VPSDTGNHYYIGIARMDRVAGQETITSGMITELLKEFRRVDTDDIADNAVTNAKMADNAVGTDELIDDSVTQPKIGPGAVGTTEMADASITNDKLQTDSVDGSNIVNGSVNTSALADGSVVSNKLAGNSVGASHIIAGSVTPSKLSAPYYFMRVWSDSSYARDAETNAGDLSHSWAAGPGDQFHWETKVTVLTFVHEFAPVFKCRLLGRVNSSWNGHFRLSYRPIQYGGGSGWNEGPTTSFSGTVPAWQECQVQIVHYFYGITIELALQAKGTDSGASPPANIEFWYPCIWAQNI